MFTRKDLLIKKTGKNGVDRRQFLTLLVQEFEKTTVLEGKQQVLTNLANFAYDPINYEFFKELNVLDLFIKQIGTGTKSFIAASIAGICNLSSDPEFHHQIIEKGVVNLISPYLLIEEDDIAVNTLTTFLLLLMPGNNPLMLSPEIINKVLYCQRSEDLRLQNLCKIFLEDHCTSVQIQQAKNFDPRLLDIPLPGET